MKKIKKVFLIIFAIIFVASVIAAIVTGIHKDDNPSTYEKGILSLEETFYVTSSVQNAVLQTYQTTVTAKIKNNTDKMLYNVVFYIDVETTVLHNQGSYTLTIPLILPHSTYTVNETVESDQNYEWITSLAYNIDGAAKCYMTNLTDEEIEEDPTYIVFIVLAVISFIIIAIMLLFEWLRRSEEKAAAAVADLHKNDDWLPWGVPVENKEKTKLEIAKIELEKEKEKSQQAKARADIEKAKVDKAKMEKEKLIVCPYCGSKIKNSEVRCPNCGGDLH